MAETLKQNLNLPENIDVILSEILLKYKLQESAEEFINKFEKGEEFHLEIVINLIKQLIQKAVSFDEFISLLATKLRIPKKTAQALAKDIKKNILILIKEPKEIPTKPGLSEERSHEEEKMQKKDIYREPIK